MPKPTPFPIQPPPGVVLTEAGKVIAGRYSNSDRVRSINRRPQKIGGWVQQDSAATSGTPRASHAWRDNAANQYFGVGTYRKLYVYDPTWTQNDVTPYRASGTLGGNPFTTTSGSAAVTVSLTAHGAGAGDTVVLSGAAAFNNVTMNGTFIVQTVVDANDFTITASTSANASGSGGGGAVAYKLEIAVGVEIGTFGYGWGVGFYGLGGYGSSRTQSTIFIEPRVFSLDHFGQLLIASYNGGSIYQFDPTQAQPWPRAVPIASDAMLPADCRYAFVTPERFVFALRAGMNVSWNSQGDLTTWTPSASNTANTRTLTVGTKLVAGRALAPYQSIVWSDAAAYLFQYTGSQFVYDSGLLARDCGLISPNAAVSINGVAYWMGSKTFWMYDGSVRQMPNVEDIRKWLYDQLDPSFAYQANAVYNPVHNDILWSFTPSGRQNPAVAVLYGIDDQAWWPQSFARASGSHFDQGDTRPLMAGTDGHVYLHEQGYDANGAAMPYSLTLAAYALEGGGDLAQILGFEWDAFQVAGTPQLTINTYDRLGDPTTEDSDTESVPAGTTLIDFFASGRYLGFVLTDNELGCYFRMGVPAALLSPRGKRR